MKINDLANSINGRVVGNDNFFLNQDFTGRFTLLNDAGKGPICQYNFNFRHTVMI